MNNLANGIGWPVYGERYFCSSHSLYLKTSLLVGCFLLSFSLNFFKIVSISSGRLLVEFRTPSSYIRSISCWLGEYGRTFSISNSGFANSISNVLMRRFAFSFSKICCVIFLRLSAGFFISRPSSICISSILPCFFQISRTVRSVSVMTCSTIGLRKECCLNESKNLCKSSGVFHFVISFASEWRLYTM